MNGSSKEKYVITFVYFRYLAGLQLKKYYSTLDFNFSFELAISKVFLYSIRFSGKHNHLKFLNPSDCFFHWCVYCVFVCVIVCLGM